jgi:N-acetylneuraminic acid mutarotase
MVKKAFFLLLLVLSSLAVTSLSPETEINRVSMIQPVFGIVNTEAVGNSWVNKTNTPQDGEIRGIAVVNGKIYAFGVYQRKQTIYATTGEYDPSTDTWTTKSPMRQPRINFATTVYKDKIYIIGGQTDIWWSPPCRTVEVYDPINDVWSYSTPMPEPRASICANLVNGKIYVIGGTTNPIPNTELGEGITNTTQVYDPDTNIWSTAAAIPEALINYASTVFEGKIFIFGGVGIFITPTPTPKIIGTVYNILETNNTRP